MNREELIEFLKENLSVEVDSDDGRLEVTINLCGDKISRDSRYLQIDRDIEQAIDRHESRHH